MADMRIPASRTTTPVPAQSPGKAEALRAAQRAFFNAALDQTPAAATPKPQAASAAAAAPTSDAPQRYLRPGSRVDIKV
jgi:hypothetical protein